MVGLCKGIGCRMVSSLLGSKHTIQIYGAGFSFLPPLIDELKFQISIATIFNLQDLTSLQTPSKQVKYLWNKLYFQDLL